jgi:hypothetical protein
VAQLGDSKLAMVLGAMPEKGSGHMAVAVSSDQGETWDIPARMAPSSTSYQTAVASLGKTGDSWTDGGLLVSDGGWMHKLDSRGGIEPVGVESYAVPEGDIIGFSSLAYRGTYVQEGDIIGPLLLYGTGTGTYARISFAANFGGSEMNVVV